MPIKTLCSDGTKISDAQIKANLSKAYKEKYFYNQSPLCEACGKARAQGSAHSIPKARLKVLGLSDKIYDPMFFWASCTSCNLKAENPQECKNLNNYLSILELCSQYDWERYQKML